MDTTIDNVTAADARLAFDEYKSLKFASKDYTEAASRLTILLDRLVADHTGFGGTFLDLVEAQKKHGYRPTFREAGNEAVAVLADVYDYCASARGLEPSYRPDRVDSSEPKGDRPATLTLQGIKERLRDLRDATLADRDTIDAAFFRSSGNEIRLSKADGDYYEYYGGWKGTIKGLKDAAERCRQKGGDTVYVGGHWLCGYALDGDFEPTECEWGISLTVEEILAIGRAAK